MSYQAAHTVTLIPGSGVGPEIAAVARDCVAATGVSIHWDEVDGLDLDAVNASLRRTKVGLKGKLIHPPMVNKTPYTIALRKALGIHTIVRHVQNIPGLPARAQGVDLVVVREASEDIYAGFEHESTTGVFETVKVTTRGACERVAVAAFELARAQGRKKVTTVHKSNILKKSDGMFLAVSQEVAARYPDISHDEVIVDALCMKLVRWPQSFDVLLCGNLFGDIVSDCAAGMAGGLMVAVGVNHGDGLTVFENPHGGTTAQIGADHGNPYPMLRLSSMLLRHLGEPDAAARLEAAVITALQAGLHTVDQNGKACCSEVASAVVRALG